MQFDAATHLGATVRAVNALEIDGKPARAIVLERTYATSVDDLWDALTNAERIPRWFMPISGDLHLNGRYQFEGNAGGQITACTPPQKLAVTWEYGGDVSWVDAELSAEGDHARLTLTHTAHLSDHWEKFGPGATGVGWELGLLGLALYIDKPDEPKADAATFHLEPDGKAFILGSAEGWGEAAVAGGEPADASRAAARRTGAFYTGTQLEED